MGCASSSPLVERGKQMVDGAKEAVADGVYKGEHALQDVGETAQVGVDTVKETFRTAVASTEAGVETVLGKIEDTFNFHSSKVNENLDDIEKNTENYINNASDTAAEVVSEAETVLASETESAKDAVISKVTPMFETIQSSDHQLKETIKDVEDHAVETLEDLEEEANEHLKDIGKSVQNSEEKVENLNDMFSRSPEKESKEELSPTIWEAAADAILLQRTIKAIDFHKDSERHFFTQTDGEVGEDINSEVAINKFLMRDNESNN